jgi:hypothetical protein
MASTSLVKNGFITSVSKSLTSVLNLESWEDQDLGPKPEIFGTPQNSRFMNVS